MVWTFCHWDCHKILLFNFLQSVIPTADEQTFEVYCCAIGHSYTVIQGHCCILGHSCANMSKEHLMGWSCLSELFSSIVGQEWVQTTLIVRTNCCDNGTSDHNREQEVLERTNLPAFLTLFNNAV
jgi:hypothetical protein